MLTRFLSSEKDVLPLVVLQSAERDMVTIFKQRGWDAFMLHPTFGAMKAGGLAFRHGMVVMQRYTELKTSWD